MYSAFTNLYSVQKTLRFELIPQGRTLEYIEKRGLLKEDEDRAAAYVKVKKIIDEYHKAFIEKTLENVELTGVEEYTEIYLKGGENADELKKAADKLRKEVTSFFTETPEFKSLFTKDLITKILPEFIKGDKEKLALLKGFDKFTTYFTGFHENRKNMYSAEEKSTAISYRLINQNLPKYIDNYNTLQKAIQFDDIKSAIGRLNIDTKDLLLNEGIEQEFGVSNYSAFITQTGIDRYNRIIGGESESERTRKKGINEIINLHNQKAKREDRVGKLKPLYKQILSDRMGFSYIPEAFHEDKEVLEAIEIIHTELKPTLHRINVMLEDFSNYRLDKVYVKNDNSLTDLSKNVFGDWRYLKDRITEYYDSVHLDCKKVKDEKYINKRDNDLKRDKSYSIEQLESLCQDNTITDYFGNSYRNDVMNRINSAFDHYEEISKVVSNKTTKLQNNKNLVAAIKQYLDELKDLQRNLKILLGAGTEVDKDAKFYAELETSWTELDVVTPLYNKVRNYLTKKPYSTDKVKLNFENPTLLDGWDLNKERDNCAVLLRKDGDYFLGIMSKGNNKIFMGLPEIKKGGYEKMEYKLLPGPNKMLPKVFFSRSRIDEFAPSERLLANYANETHKKGENFNIKDCHELIDFFKESINKHEDWSQFGFCFSPTKTYDDLSGFYREVEAQGYKVSFKNISDAVIDSYVDEGKLYLFRIYNKDFSQYSKGTPNLHTLYWKMLFDEENLKNPVYKLNGQAEVFYRKASIEKDDIIMHKAKQPMENKNALNGKTHTTLDYDVIKDKRYTVDKFQFHVPITMNFKAEGQTRLNEHTKMAIRNNKENYVIGIDRGERHLLYISVIDSKGRIVEQTTLNRIVASYNGQEMPAVDYHALLDNRERARDEERRNWQSIESIKELKEGYLSQVVHYITNLMVKYNAILVMEDLNSGFKRSRQKVEKQVYQKFEKMLIDKLNYLVDKKKSKDELGGLLNAYQLANKFESFQKLGKQSGMVFYTEAWNTSKIDPVTGFTNLFDTRYKNVEISCEFWSKFKTIKYDNEKNMFAFSFDYSDFPRGAQDYRKRWTVYSNDDRIKTFRTKSGNWEYETVVLTDRFIELFNNNGIDYTATDLVKPISSKNQKSDSQFHKELLALFGLTLQMRNSKSGTEEDYIISPVPDKKGCFYDSRNGIGELPIDADANGAYNIARKGLIIIDRIKAANKEELRKTNLLIKNKEWLEYAQSANE